MKFNNKILFLTIVLLAMISLGAVSASEDANSLKDNSDVLSASQDEAIPLSSNDYNKTVYVDSHGDDSGAGTESSPYASLDKAMSDIDASDNAIIYMGAGVYTGEKNTDLNINFAHKNYKGSLTIAGAGAGKTIIDANLESPIFNTISADSIVILKDITFINGKKNLGSAITNNGDLTIDSCVFENNSAGAYATVYQDDPNNLKVVNSVFRNNVAGSANNDIYYYDEDAGYNVTLINSSFYNAASTYNWGDSASVVIQATNVLVQGNNFTNISSSGKSSLQVRSPNGKIINNFFKDCSYTGSSGAILYIAGPGIYLEGNRFENWVSTSNSPIYALMNYNAKLTFNNLTVDGTTFKLTCNLTDDMGNLVTSYYKVNFYFDGKKIGEAQANGGLATLTITKLLGNGNYSLTGDYGNENPMGCDVINATVIVDFNHNPMDVWVSPTGNDTTGNGSEDNPFQTIKTAIDYAIDEDSVEITIHAKEGTYNIQGDYGLSYSDAISLSIVGEKYGKVIIDGNNANGFITSGVYTNVFLQNLTFVNGTGRYSRSFEVRYLTMKDCIVNNSGMLYAQTSPSGIVFDNVIWTNSKNLLMYNGEIYNSHFENITSSGTGNLWLATVNNDDEIIIENSKFINLVTSGSSGAGVAYVQGNFRSINNTYESNKATSNNYGALYVYGNKLVSINDTFINNEASGNYGAAAFFNGRENPSVQIINAKFINNTAGGFGGALGIYGGELINCTFENNTAATLGGAIYMPTHSNTVYLYDLTLDNVIFDGNVAGTNGQDIYIVPATNANNLNSNLNGMTVSMNDLFTTTLQDFVQANVTHSSGAVVGGGAVTFYLSGAYMGVANVVDGVAVLDYLGFKTNGTYVLSGEYNLATADTAYNNATVIVALAPLKDNVTLYVSDSKGDDVNGDGSLDNPYKTIKTALTNGYKQSSVIVVRVLEGNYSGELNNNLTIAASLYISIIGDGQGVTIIDGQDVNWFLNILAGDSMIKLANMTVANVTKNYVDAKLYNQMPALTIEKGAVVLIDNVEFIRCHGTEGGAIYSAGTLNVVNSRFFNNGDSNYGAAIKNYGTLTIDKSEFIANHAKYYSTIYNDGQLFIYNSFIQDSMRVNGWTGNAMVMGGAGNITMVNSTISRSGKTSAELIGTGQTWANNPGFVISIGSTGNVKVIDSVIDGHDKAYSAQYVSNVAFGGSGSIGVFVPYGLEVVNTKLLNLKDLISNSKGTNYFDSCYIENVTYVSEGTSYDFNLTVVNSYFADGTTMVTKRATANVVLDNNWWGSNDQPTYKVSNVATTPNTWLILTLELSDEPGSAHDLTLAFKVTDGNNITDYTDELYPRDYVVSVIDGTSDLTTGTIVNGVKGHFEDSDYGLYRIEATVDGQTLKITEKGFADIFAEDVGLKVGETKFDVVVLVNNVSISDFNINLTVNNKTYVAPVIDGVASFEIEELAYGNYTLDYFIEDNDLCYEASNSANLTVSRYDPSINFVSNVTDQVIIILTGNDGAPLSGVDVSYSVNGYDTVNTTDENGQIIISDLRDVVDIVASYDGDGLYNPVTVEKNVTVFNGRKATKISIVSVDGYLNVTGVLTDIDGNPIANAIIEYGVVNGIDTVTTDDDGRFSILGVNDEIAFVFAETYDYLTSNATLSLKDIAPIRQATAIEITLGDIKVKNDVNVTISVPNVTGELKVYVDNKDAVTVPLIDGNANYTINAVTVGNHTIVVVYLGDSTHEASVSSEYFTVEKEIANVNVTIGDAKAGEDVNVTVSVPGATGSIVFIVDGVETTVPLDENATAIHTIADVAAGEHNVVVIYSGDDTHDAVYKVDSFDVAKETADVNITLPVDYKIGESANVTVSIPNATGNVSVIVDGVETTVPLDENGTAVVTIPEITPGEHGVVVMYSGDDTYAPFVNVTSFYAEVFGSEFRNLTVDGDGFISGYLYILDGPVANATITYIINGIDTNTTTDEDGMFSFNATFPATVEIYYAGTDAIFPSNVTITLRDIAQERQTSVIVAEDYYSYAIDYNAGERGGYFKVQLVDEMGNPLANKAVKIGFNGKVYNSTTNETGWAQLQINLAGAGTYTFAVAFLGDDNYNASFVVQKIVVTKKKTTIDAPAKSYKASDKTKSYTVTLKTDKGSSIDGKTYLASGKKITLTLNGKTYTAKTNSKGQATFKLSITKKGTFSTTVKFDGDKTYEASSKSVKITIK